MVYYCDANSWNSTAQFPVAGFLDRMQAEDFASKQPGYGLNKDWFIKTVPLDIGDSFIITPSFQKNDRVDYKDVPWDDFGTVTAVEFKSNILWYEVTWDDGEPTDWYRDNDLRKIE